MKITNVAGVTSAATQVGVAVRAYARSNLGKFSAQIAETALTTSPTALADAQLYANPSPDLSADKAYCERVCALGDGTNTVKLDEITPHQGKTIFRLSDHGYTAVFVAMHKGTRQHHWSFAPMMPSAKKLTDGEIVADIGCARKLHSKAGIV